MDLAETGEMEKMKIAMVGESGVGKTCLINRYVSNVFDATDATTAASFKSRTLSSHDNSISIRQMIWDTAGQEVYRSLASFYYRDADAVVLVYDVTNKKSFEELIYWVGEINQHSTKSVLLTLAGNKSDRVDDEQVDITDAKEYAKSIGASFFMVSAKENYNIVEMYTELGMRKFPEFRSKFGYEIDPSRDSIKKVSAQSKGKNKRKDNDKLKLNPKSAQKERKNCC
eukprot:TRINITY_DN12155_c0_g4_i2.p1 TRINITY_DN12155_c0_g4~~TRINITY_DN12155_c0_g4_i2.p1  ORF type:complete len:227 (-),score=54.38 TRINITY_DN12155_c0_g4_i2:78-758(-)